jgi:hypothetical protein
MSQPQPSPEPRPDTDDAVDDAVDTSALERSAESIGEARGALGTVAANDDVSTGDQEQAGTYSQDPGEAAENTDTITSTSGPADPEGDKADPDAP